MKEIVYMQQQNIIQNIYQSTKTIKGKLQLHHRPPLHTRPYQGELQQDFQRSTTRTDIYNLVLCTKTCIGTQHVINLNNKLMRTFSYVNNLNNKLMRTFSYVNNLNNKLMRTFSYV